VKRLLIIPAAAAILAATAGCTPEPESGTVTELEYEPETFFTSQVCTPRYDAKGRYKGQTCTPTTTYYPECFEVDYEDEATEATGEDCVSEELFEALEVGDLYTKGMTASDA
jgi:hypothetical protein